MLSNLNYMAFFPYYGYFGLVLLVLGEYTFYCSFRDLGEALNPATDVRPKAKLVSTGVYRRVRHPMFSGILLMFLGVGFVFGNFVMFLCFFAAVVMLQTVRIPVEERILLKEFGKDYEVYMKQTPGLIPKLC